MWIQQRFAHKIVEWLGREQDENASPPICDYDRISHEVRVADVLLIEGKNRVSDYIRSITQSPWTHSALYVGRLYDIANPVLRSRVQEYYSGPLDQQLVIESVLGKGTIASPLEKFRGKHIRICRPKGLAHKDAQKVVEFAISHLGMAYDIRHNLDLARFLLPWRLLPKKWRSSLFKYRPGVATKEICSLMIAEAFNSVHFPILPVMKSGKKGIKLYKRNPRLYTPSDFDYSPFFEIIKYPILEIADAAAYRHLPWTQEEDV